MYCLFVVCRCTMTPGVLVHEACKAIGQSLAFGCCYKLVFLFHFTSLFCNLYSLSHYTLI